LSLGELESFEGTIPSELGMLTDLDTLKLSYMPNMHGPLPSEIGELVNLVALDLRLCSFVGTLPTEYAQLENLVKFDVAYNSGVNGTIPSEYGKMSALSKSYILLYSFLIYIELSNLTRFPRYIQIIENVFMHGTSLSGNVSPVFCSVDFVHFSTECKGDDEITCTCCTECYNTP
jgi:hypothetical protein